MKVAPDSSLTPVQFEILQAAWNHSPGASVAEIWETISASRSVTRTTVLNLVDRLEKRGWLARRKIDGVFRYTPAVDRQTATRKVVAEFVDAFFSGSASELVMNLVGSKRISPDEMAELRALLDQRDRPSQKKGGAKMNFLSDSVTFVPVLVYLANVAAASLILCGVGLVIERICRRASLPFRHSLLVAALASALMAPIVIGGVLSNGRSLIRLSVAGPQEVNSTTRWSAPATDGQHLSAHDLAPADAVSQSNAVDLQEVVSAASTQREVDGTTLTISDRSGRWLWQELPILCGLGLAIVWIAGGAVSVVRLTRGLVQVRRLMRGLRPVADSQLHNLAAATMRQLGLRKPPELGESPDVLAPLSVGLVHQVIILPVGLASSFDIEQLQGMLFHEMAHLARRDHLIGLLQRAVTIVFWWNVLAHRVSRRVSALREQICDDISACDGREAGYAAMLVELAERVVHAPALPATIGVFDGPASELGQRVRRLLDPRRRIVTRLDGRSKLAAALCFLLLLLPSIAPLHIRAAAADESPPLQQAKESPATRNPESAQDSVKAPPQDAADAAPLQWPTILRGVIKDSTGKPIAGASVRFDFDKIHEYSIGRWDELLDSQTQVTGENGEYRFDATSLPPLTHRPFSIMLTCTAQGYADSKWWCWYNRRDTSVGEHLIDITMPAGRAIRGRCLDPSGAPMSGAIVKIAQGHDPKSPNSNWAWDPRKTGDDGVFEFNVPQESEEEFEVWAVHPRWAPRRVSLPNGGGDSFGDIQLEPGASLYGTVRKADGTPTAGTVVVAESVDGGQLRGVSFSVHAAARTDDSGNYKLPPLAGAYKLYLSQACKTDDSVKDLFVVADEAPPMIAPARMELSGHEPLQHDFQAGPTLKVRGTVRWGDGTPVPRCEVQASYLPPHNGTGIWIGRTVTDDQGHYTIGLPNPIEHVSINCAGAFDERRVWHSASPGESVVAQQKSKQNIRVGPLEGDLEGIDWVLRQRNP